MVGIIGAGMTFVILTGGIDLSVGSAVALAGVVSATVMVKTNSIIMAIISGLLVGLIVGGLNGLIITKGKLPPFIATLGTMVFVRGIVMVTTNGSPITTNSNVFNYMGKGKVAAIPVPVLILIVVYIIGYYILKYTKYGRSVYCLGGNREATRLSGINTQKIEFKVYVICGLLAGLTGLILTARLGSAQPTAGTSYELDAIAAVILGGTSLTGGQGFIVSTVIGAMILGVLDNILVLMNFNPFATEIVKGAVIILAVLVDAKFKNLSSKVENEDKPEKVKS
jgi:ribose transport system permease protein